MRRFWIKLFLGLLAIALWPALALAAPTANAGGGQTLDEGVLATLDGSLSADGGGGPLTYAWVKIAGPAVALSDPGIVKPSFLVPFVGPTNASLTFQLTVTDVTGASDTDQVIININWNTDPVADAGNVQGVSGYEVELDGSASSDPDAQSLTYAWQQTSGPTVTLDDDSLAKPKFLAPYVSDATVMGFTLTVTDPGSKTDTDTALVTIVPNRWDATADSRVGLDDAILALQTSAGLKVDPVPNIDPQTGSDYPLPLAQTGQAHCYNASGNWTSCTGTGQDAEFKNGVALPAPRFTDRGDGTVLDNLTHLVWLKNPGCLGFKTFFDALSLAAELYHGNPGSTLDETCGLSDGSGAGDWRVPNRKELDSILDLNYSRPAISAGHPFLGVYSANYWSSTTYVQNGIYGWVINLLAGKWDATDFTNTNRVWLVRDLRAGE